MSKKKKKQNVQKHSDSLKFLPKKIKSVSTKEVKGYALPIYALSLQGLPFDNEENLLTFE